jgi:hypothetical protein
MNGKWTKDNFISYDNAHPEIYRMFVEFTLQVAKKRKRYSAKNVFHRIRWETTVSDTLSCFKIDDGWISHYARKFAEDYPEYSSFFEFRTRASSYHGDE